MNYKAFKWVARLIALAAIAFMIMFSLDCFDGEYSLQEKLICLFMHNIPAFILVISLIIAWKWELAGGMIFIFLSMGMSIFFRSFTGNPWSLIVIGPFLITGILFILAWHYKPKGESEPENNE